MDVGLCVVYSLNRTASLGVGIPNDGALNYEAQIKAGTFVVIAHGT